jgi:hypothetical protein
MGWRWVGWEDARYSRVGGGGGVARKRRCANGERKIMQKRRKRESDFSVSIAGSCEHGNVSSSSIKLEEFLDQLSDRQLLQDSSAPWNEFRRLYPFGLKNEEVKWGWRKLHYDELHNCILHLILAVKLRRLWWAQHAGWCASGKWAMRTKCCSEILKEDTQS